MGEGVVDNFKIRMEACIHVGGGHLDVVIFLFKSLIFIKIKNRCKFLYILMFS